MIIQMMLEISIAAFGTIRTSCEDMAPSAKSTAADKYALDNDDTQVLIPEEALSPAACVSKVLPDSPPLKEVLGSVEPRADTWPEWWTTPLESVVSGVSCLRLSGKHAVSQVMERFPCRS